MRISVALATYNGSRFLQEQLASLAGQTVLPDELVVSDDGSTDETVELVRRFAATAPFPVRVLDKDARLGFADNFLHAASECRGDVVAFSDQDDVWLPTKIEAGLARMVADDSLLSMHRLTVTDINLRPTGEHEQGIGGDAVFNALDLDPHNTGWGNTMMFRRELAILIPRDRRPRQPGDKRPLSHDTWIYVLAAALGRVSHIAAPLILYRQHEANVFGVTPPLFNRLMSLGRSPVHGHRERMVFNATMARLLGELAGNGKGQVNEAARDAAIRFAERRERLALRMSVYEGGSLVERVRAFRAVMNALDADSAALKSRAGVAAKDLLLGVSGIDRLAGRRRDHPVG